MEEPAEAGETVRPVRAVRRLRLRILPKAGGQALSGRVALPVIDDLSDDLAGQVRVHIFAPFVAPTVRR
jgi:hypothetical protein